MNEQQQTRTSNSQSLDGTYNVALGLPAGAAAPWVGVLRLQYSQHAAQEARSDRYGKLELFPEVEFEAGDVVEVLVEQGRAVKAVVRFPMEDGRDLVFVLNRPEAGQAVVRTVWANQGSDKHRSLNRAAYRLPQKNFAVS